VATVDITPSPKRKPLKVNYGDEQFLLSTRIPLELINAQDSIPRPKVMAGSQKDAYQQQVGIAVIAAFVENVITEEFRAVLDLNDVAQVFEAWSEASGWGKSPSSDNSGGGTKNRSSSNYDEAD